MGSVVTVREMIKGLNPSAKDFVCKTAGVSERRHPAIVSTGQDNVLKGVADLFSAHSGLSPGQLVELQA